MLFMHFPSLVCDTVVYTIGMKKLSEISIYEYSDYRLFLKAYYEEQKEVRGHFSYQFWADHAGFKSKTFLYKVIRGEKALTLSGALKVGSFMKLKKRELDYFEAIVLFTNAKKIDEKEFYFAKLQKFSRNSSASTIRQNQFEYFNHWYNSVVRELVAVVNWGEDYALLGRSLTPPISAREAKQSVLLLLDLGFISRDEEGHYHRACQSITTGGDVISLAVNHFQKENLQLAAAAIDRFPREQRDISTLTMSLSEAGAQRIMDEIAAFRKKLVAIVEEDSAVDRVYQINFQAFPLSKPKKEF